MKITITLCALLAFANLAQAKHQLRQWKNKDGKPAIAKFQSYSDGVVKLKSISGKAIKLPVSKLSNEDKIYLRSITRDSRLRFDAPSLSDKERLLIPSINQVAFGNTDKNCGPNAAANFFMWWDKEGVLPLPYREKKLDDLADRLHKDLENTMRTSNGTSSKNFVEGLAKFIDKKGLAKKYKFEKSEFKATMENMEEAAKDSKMAVLSLQVLKNHRMDEGHYVSLISCEDGIVTFNTWGQKFTGKLKPGVMNKKKVIFIELVQEPGSQIYHWLDELGGGFVIEEDDKIVTLEVTKKTRKKK